MINDRGVTMTEKLCLAAGEWTLEGKRFPVLSPYDGSTAGEALRPSADVVEMAVKGAVKVFPVMKGMKARQRAEILKKASALIRERGGALARLISLESGKPIRYAAGEAARAVHTFSEAAEECSRLYGETIPLDTSTPGEGRMGMTGWFPVGPVLAITPFNFPLNLVAHKLAPAIAAGCSVILKPSSDTPLTALMLADILIDSGLPAGALSVLPMSGAEAGLLAERPEIKKVTFTGSAPVGWELKKRAHMKKVTLELGGNAAVVLHDDWDDIPGAAARIAVGGYAYSGQVCISVQRIFVQNGIYDSFMKEFSREVSAIRRGDPLDEATGIGPMINEAEAVRVEQWVDEAVSAGAALTVGGPREGSFYPPTILENTLRGMKAVDDEIFGPVTAVSRYESFDEALAGVNDSRFGLQAGVFTHDARLIKKAFETLEVGGVIAGDFPTFRVDRMPYGGVKESGSGREGLRWAIRDMCELRLLVLS
jgi:acyl-CoA reductase-like NAD-dependent aldehyde dehydrogenase